MVPLEDKMTYLEKIDGVPKLTAFNNLLVGKSIVQPEVKDLSEIDEIYYGILIAIQNNDKSLFEKFYERKNKSNPNKESPSPFVNDDFFIFSLIIGIIKFSLDKTWIKNIISIRNRNPLTVTFENIINDNNFSKSNVSEIVLMYFKLDNQGLITNDFLATVFQSIKDNTELFKSKSDFHILCSLNAYDLIVDLKELSDGNEISLLKKFNSKFLKRAKRFAWFFQTLLLVGLFYGLIALISKQPDIKTWVDKLGSVLKFLSLFGISQLGNLLPAIKEKLYHFTLMAFGYPKELIKKLDDKVKK